MTARFITFLACLLLVPGLLACDRIAQVGTSVSGNLYDKGTPVGGHIVLLDYYTGETVHQGQTQTGHFIIQGVKAGEYVMRAMDMRAIPMGGGMYLKVLPGRPVTELKFDRWQVVPPPEGQKDKDGNPYPTKEAFMEKFSMSEAPPS